MLWSEKGPFLMTESKYHGQTTLDGSVALHGGTHSLRSYLQLSDLDECAPDFEVWNINESSRRLAYLTHGVFRFFGKFPPPVAERFIRELHDASKGPIVDPMVGSGTTLLEAMRVGRHSIGFDTNPLCTLISKVKTTYIPPERIRHQLEGFDSGKNQLEPADAIPKDRHTDHWFFKRTQNELAIIRAFVDSLRDRDEDVYDALRVSLAATVRQVSRASKGLGRMFLDPGLQPRSAFEVFYDRSNELVRAISSLKGLGPSPMVETRDARQTGLGDETAGLVIVHPPYFNLYKYSSIYRFELLWLGYDPKKVASVEVKEGFKHGDPRLLPLYLKDMHDVLGEIARILAPRCSCVLLVGDTVIKNRRVNTTSRLLRMISDLPLQINRIVVRVPKYTEASYATAQRRDRQEVGVKLADHLVIFQKI